MDHWQLNELDSLAMFPRDYRMSATLYEKCGAVKDVKEYLQETYGGTTAVEFAHVSDEGERLWCYEKFEEIAHSEITNDERLKALQLLVRTEGMEHFMQKKFATHKRYSSEGSEAVTVAINSLIAEASKTSQE